VVLVVSGGGIGLCPEGAFGLKAALFWLNGIAAVAGALLEIAGRFSGVPAGLAIAPGICDEESLWLLFIDKINMTSYCKKPLLSREIAQKAGI
jgi:hypothetical protein